MPRTSAATATIIVRASKSWCAAAEGKAHDTGTSIALDTPPAPCAVGTLTYFYTQREKLHGEPTKSPDNHYKQ